MKELTKIIGIAFGDPLAIKTFSGYSHHLFDMMNKLGFLHSTKSTRDLRIVDVLSGMVNFKRVLEGKKPNISSHWLWKPETVEILSKRMNTKLNNFDKNIPVLQVGTHVWPIQTDRDFYCVTDMTVLQAAEAGQFEIKKLSGKEIDVAIKLQKKMFDSYKKIFVLCDWTKQDIVKNYNQPETKVIVIGAGANIDMLEPAENKFRSKEILFVGFDWQRKGGQLLLEAFLEVKEEIHDAVLNIVGCEPDIDISGVNVIGRLQKNKPSEAQKLNSLYKTANCFCILPEFDPFPNVLLEAQKCSTPVVSLLDGSRMEAVVDGKTGFLVKDKTISGVANAFKTVLSSEETAQEMGQNAKNFILDNFTWEKVCHKIVKAID